MPGRSAKESSRIVGEIFLQAGCPSCHPNNSFKAPKNRHICFLFTVNILTVPFRPPFILSCMHCMIDRSYTAPLNRLPCYGALEIIVTSSSSSLMNELINSAPEELIYCSNLDDSWCRDGTSTAEKQFADRSLSGSGWIISHGEESASSSSSFGVRSPAAAAATATRRGRALLDRRPG